MSSRITRSKVQKRQFEPERVLTRSKVQKRRLETEKVITRAQKQSRTHSEVFDSGVCLRGDSRRRRTPGCKPGLHRAVCKSQYRGRKPTFHELGLGCPNSCCAPTYRGGIPDSSNPMAGLGFH